MSNRTFLEDVRDFLRPQRGWHYIFHALVILITIVYWVVSVLRLPSGSMNDIIMYKPEGDTQIYPIVTAFSRLNFGEPTDFKHYGEGLLSFPIACVLPHALAYAAFGKAGYVVADVVLSCFYFLMATLFLRQCNFGRFASLFAGAALATNSLQALAGKLAEAFCGIFASFNLALCENEMPNLFELSLFAKRVHRPMFTEAFVLLSLYFLLKLWRERRAPRFRNGLAVGSAMAMVMQGDIWLFSTLGLLLAWVFGWSLARNGWKVPWGFIGGGLLGGLLFGWLFLYQRMHDDPEILVRFGVVSYSRWRPLLLPGYAPLLRVAVVSALAGLVLWACRRGGGTGTAGPGAEPALRRDPAGPMPAAANDGPRTDPPERLLATFFVALLVASWLAQPLHAFLLGRAAQIYHFLFSVPVVYGYAVIVLGCSLLKLTLPPGAAAYLRQVSLRPRKREVFFLACTLAMGTILAVEKPIARTGYLRTPRGADVFTEPWAQIGDLYRPSLRDLDRAFSENPVLKQSRTFLTLDLDVYVMLTAFHDKRAFLPVMADSVAIKDAEFERRFREIGRLMQVDQASFRMFIQQYYILCYWLGSAKYRFATDHKYSKDEDYRLEDIHFLSTGFKQWGWSLVMPNSEIERLGRAYDASLSGEADVDSYPDLIVLTAVEKGSGMLPREDWYEAVPSTNQAFFIYRKSGAHAFGTLLGRAEKGDALAQLALAQSYLHGRGVAADPKQAFMWVTRAAQQGLASAENQLGLLYAHGQGTEIDYAASVPWFEKAADQGDLDSQFNLGQLYESGMGVPRDAAKAADRYRRAAEKGHAEAQNSLGLICYNLQKDYAAAMHWLRLAADQGHVAAANSVGVLHLHGLGTKQDAAEAANWFHQAAKNGCAEAQDNLGTLLVSQQRHGEAAQWFRQGADQGLAVAQFNLAQLIEHGLGCPKDPAEAMLWYSRSAHKGHAFAQFELGKMYEGGQGVKPDRVEAYKWFKLAERQGLPGAHDAATNCAARMAPKEWGEAQAELERKTP